MKRHTASELKYTAQLLGPDGTTVLIRKFRVGVEDLTGRRLEQAQLINAETSHLILARRGDVGGLLTSACYVVCDGLTYIVDWPIDPRVPRSHMWVEIYCHVEGTITILALPSDLLLEDGVSRLMLEDGTDALLLEGSAA